MSTRADAGGSLGVGMKAGVDAVEARALLAATAGVAVAWPRRLPAGYRGWGPGALALGNKTPKATTKPYPARVRLRTYELGSMRYERAQRAPQ